jgi:hypothetical protein
MLIPSKVKASFSKGEYAIDNVYRLKKCWIPVKITRYSLSGRSPQPPPPQKKLGSVGRIAPIPSLVNTSLPAILLSRPQNKEAIFF